MPTNTTTLKNAFEGSKSVANKNIIQAFSKLQGDLTNSVNSLLGADQAVAIDVDEIVKALNGVRDEWLNHVNGTFDTQSTQLRSNLQRDTLHRFPRTLEKAIRRPRETVKLKTYSSEDEWPASATRRDLPYLSALSASEFDV